MTSDKFLECSAYFTSAVLILLLSRSFVKVYKGTHFQFVQVIIGLLLLSNVAFIIYTATYEPRRAVLENVNSTRKAQVGIVALNMICDAVRYGCYNVMIWVFAFKYWIVSIEIPKAISRSSEANNTAASATQRQERTYYLVQWAGIIINTAAVILYAVYYGKLIFNSDSARYERSNIVTYQIMNCLAAVSGLFLGDALRRIHKTFSETRGILSNERAMVLHFVFFFVTMLMACVRTVAMVNFNKHRGTKSTLDIVYTVSIWTMFCDQLILCHLFFKYSTPSPQIAIQSSGSVSLLPTASHDDTESPRESPRDDQTEEDSESASDLLQTERLSYSENRETPQFQLYIHSLWGQQESDFRQAVFVQFGQSEQEPPFTSGDFNNH